MQVIRTFFRKIIFFGINNLIKINLFLRIFNFFYERASHSLVIYFARHIKFPNKNTEWKIKLYNDKVVKTKIFKDNPKTWEFALSYKWHDRGLNMLETLITNYFNDNLIWVDCGANLGIRSLTALSNKIKVIMIEPNLELNSICNDRCKLNNFQDFKVLPFGISDENSIKKFYIDDSSYLSTLCDNILEKDSIKSIETIEVKKLDTLLHDFISTNSKLFIKIDIEGHEIEALHGAEELIKKLKPTFVIEINEKGKHIDYIFKYMKRMGYQIYEINDLMIGNKFLKISSYHFTTNDFLFVNDLKLISHLKEFII